MKLQKFKIFLLGGKELSLEKVSKDYVLEMEQ